MIAMFEDGKLGMAGKKRTTNAVRQPGNPGGPDEALADAQRCKSLEAGGASRRMEHELQKSMIGIVDRSNYGGRGTSRGTYIGGNLTIHSAVGHDDTEQQKSLPGQQGRPQQAPNQGGSFRLYRVEVSSAPLQPCCDSTGKLCLLSAFNSKDGSSHRVKTTNRFSTTFCYAEENKKAQISISMPGHFGASGPKHEARRWKAWPV
ncbi:hypothetical protein B0T13DRAFT_503356 [Neurospora crassa]|nr:hypothetical protein B0T13DRAFT_503356 [Neurospora crassa]